MKAIGVYIHVPYCRTICPYCDFNVHRASRAGEDTWAALGRAIDAELTHRAPAFEHGAAASVYFGGGTPSLAAPDWIEARLSAVDEVLSIRPGAEITLEVEPDTAPIAALQAHRAHGVNRASVGWQSTHDDLLRRLGRGHTAAAADATLRMCRDAGFDRVSADLIFAVPGQTLDHLHQDLDTLVAHNPEHVSTYSLTFHEGTPFHRMLGEGRLQSVDEELEITMMETIVERLGSAGIERYEVSNFARPGMRAEHNSSYWSGRPYLGLGPGAHSYLRRDWSHGWRWENARSPDSYIDAWKRGGKEGRPVAGEPSVNWVENLSQEQLIAEWFLCGLRTTDGVDLSDEPVGSRVERWQGAIERSQSEGWALLEGHRLRPTHLGLQYADSLAGLFL